MTNPHTIAGVLEKARLLTKAQKALLCEMPCTCDETYRPARRLCQLGLATFGYVRFGVVQLALTTLGLAVREHLREAAAAARKASQ